MSGSKKVKSPKPALRAEKATRKSAVRKKAAPSKALAAKGTRKAQAIPQRTLARKTRPPAKGRSLGRPQFPADTKLELVFQKDYQAREVFEFLGVQTVRELETYGPAEIIEKLTGPLVQTVERIRKSLALGNRCLANDLRFALDFQARLKREL